MTSTRSEPVTVARIRYLLKKCECWERDRQQALKLRGNVLRAIRDNAHMGRTMWVCDALYAQGFGDVPPRAVRKVLQVLGADRKRGPEPLVSALEEAADIE